MVTTAALELDGAGQGCDDFADVGILLQDRAVERRDDARIFDRDLRFLHGELRRLDGGQHPFVARVSGVVIGLRDGARADQFLHALEVYLGIIEIGFGDA